MKGHFTMTQINLLFDLDMRRQAELHTLRAQVLSLRQSVAKHLGLTLMEYMATQPEITNCDLRITKS